MTAEAVKPLFYAVNIGKPHKKYFTKMLSREFSCHNVAF
jgi:hypothetical protein